MREGGNGGEVSTSLAFQCQCQAIFLISAMRYALCAMRLGLGVMTSYLVRIYRRANYNPRLLVGVAEEGGVHEKKAFSNLYELWDILNPLKRSAKERRKVKTNRKNKPREKSVTTM